MSEKPTTNTFWSEAGEGFGCLLMMFGIALIVTAFGVANYLALLAQR